jgi:MoaA/NifB/PqqE/SkfB family radical SAM enzyme
MNSLKARLTLFLLGHHVRALLRGEASVARVVGSLRRQLVLSSLFKAAKYSRVGDRIFIDPFAPYFPSRYCRKLFDNNTDPTLPPKPNFAQISITNRCPCECVHCHVENTQGADLPKEKLLETIEEISRADFPLLFFVGGEPLSRFGDLLEFLELARKSMDTRIFTSGVGVTPERLKALRRAGLEGICVSLDHHREALHDGRRRHPGAFQAACETIREAAGLGLYVSVVCCTSSSMVRSGDAFRVADLAESLGAHSIQLNEIRPVGRALRSGDPDLFLTREDKEALVRYYERSNRSRRKLAIVMPWWNEEPDRFGCTATSGQQAYVDASGNVQPCPLLKVGLGNIGEEPFGAIWERFRVQCRHPVRECLVHRLSGELASSSVLPLPPAKTYELWPELCHLEPTETFQRLQALQPEAWCEATRPT